MPTRSAAPTRGPPPGSSRSREPINYSYGFKDNISLTTSRSGPDHHPEHETERGGDSLGVARAGRGHRRVRVPRVRLLARLRRDTELPDPQHAGAARAGRDP